MTKKIARLKILSSRFGRERMKINGVTNTNTTMPSLLERISHIPVGTAHHLNNRQKTQFPAQENAILISSNVDKEENHGPQKCEENPDFYADFLLPPDAVKIMRKVKFLHQADRTYVPLMICDKPEILTKNQC